MRVLCTTTAPRSHFFPMVPLAWAAAVPHVRTAEAMIEDLLPFARHWQPDLVLAGLGSLMSETGRRL